MNEKLKNLVIIVILIGIISFVVDFNNGFIESYSALFINGLNVLVMGTLTYYLLIVNRKVSSLNERAIALEENNQRDRKLDVLIRKRGKVNDYERNLQIIIYMTLLHLPTNEKRRLILSDDDYIFGMIRVHEVVKREIRAIDLFPINDMEKERINKVFYERTPNSVKAFYRNSHVDKSYSVISRMATDEDLYFYGSAYTLIVDSLNILDSYLTKIIDDNGDVTFPKMNVEDNHAGIIFNFAQIINDSLLVIKNDISESIDNLNDKKTN